MSSSRQVRGWITVAGLACLAFAACSRSSSSASPPASGAAGVNAAAQVQAPQPPPAATTGGFDGARAYRDVQQLVAIGPHSPGSEGIRRAQGYIIEQLKQAGCPVQEQDFHASTSVGTVAMKNILAKIPGTGANTILITTHYDSKQMEGFVGADDGASSTAVVLELARLLCPRRGSANLWLVFFDGEEAFGQWSRTDGTYGSRQLAASLALGGELRNVRAMILADMVGAFDLRIKREANSTTWLTNLIWETAARLGYAKTFLNDSLYIEDDHTPFLARGVPAVDIIGFEVPYWHTVDDTLDKIDPRSLSIVGHVLIEALPEIEKRVR